MSQRPSWQPACCSHHNSASHVDGATRRGAVGFPAQSPRPHGEAEALARPSVCPAVRPGRVTWPTRACRGAPEYKP